MNFTRANPTANIWQCPVCTKFFDKTKIFHSYLDETYRPNCKSFPYRTFSEYELGSKTAYNKYQDISK